MAAKKKKVAKKADKGVAVKTAAPPTVLQPVVTELPKVREQTVDKAKHQAMRNYIGQMKTAGNVVMLATEATSTYALRRPSGIMQLDIDCAGGLPSGGLCTVVGPDGTGKSELLYLYMAQHQRIYGHDSRLALAHTEGQFDFWRAKRMGLQISVPKAVIEERRAIHAARGQPDLTKEFIEYLQFGIGDFVFIGGSSGEDTLDAIIAAVASDAFGIVGIDSLQGLIPQADADKEMDEREQRAAFATMITKFMKHYIPLTAGLSKPNFTSLVAISQVRSNPDKGTNPYAPDFVAQLARAMKHYHLIEITLTSGQQIRKSIRGEQVTIGKELKWKITKGKAGAHDHVSGSTSLTYPEYSDTGAPIDTIGSIVIAGIRYGVIREDPRNGKVFVVRQSERDREVVDTSPSMQALQAMMRIDPDFEHTIRQEILLAANLDCRYR